MYTLRDKESHRICLSCITIYSEPTEENKFPSKRSIWHVGFSFQILQLRLCGQQLSSGKYFEGKYYECAGLSGLVSNLSQSRLITAVLSLARSFTSHFTHKNGSIQDLEVFFFLTCFICYLTESEWVTKSAFVLRGIDQT